MFTRNGQVLGSALVDPRAYPRPPAKKAAAKVVEPEPTVVVEDPIEPEVPVVVPEPEAEAVVEPEPVKRAPAKKAVTTFKSALDKPEG